jgi:hypothetical protein
LPQQQLHQLILSLAGGAAEAGLAGVGAIDAGKAVAGAAPAAALVAQLQDAAGGGAPWQFNWLLRWQVKPWFGWLAPGTGQSGSSPAQARA